MIASETKALADDILISGINSFIFSYLFALIWHTLGYVTFLLVPPRVGLARSNGYDQLAVNRAILTGATRGVAQHENGEETSTNSETYQTPRNY